MKGVQAMAPSQGHARRISRRPIAAQPLFLPAV